MASINLPHSITTIGRFAFHSCCSLNAVNIPDGVRIIREGVFDSCSSLLSISLPDGVTRIDKYAFCGCESLTSIDVPDSITWIGEGAFIGCAKLTALHIPVGIPSIEDSTFEGCHSLANVVLPSGVTSIGKCAFYDCDGLTQINIPDSVTSVGSSAFYNCDSLRQISIPGSVASIGILAFSNCGGLESISLADGVKSIGIRAFGNCESLESITIPNSVTFLGETAFADCDSLKNVYIGEGISSINNYLLKNCVSLENVVIPNTVTSIGNEAFYGCLSITSIQLSNQLQSIGDYAFYNCGELKSVTMPDSVNSIGICAFANCSNLTDILIPEKLTTIAAYVFFKCSNLETANIPDGVTTIGYAAFYGCNYTYINIPASVTSIGVSALSNCWNVWVIQDSYAHKSCVTYGFSYHIAAQNITLDKTNVSLDLVKWETVTLKATVLPTKATEPLQWTSSNPAVATVADGKVTPLAVGTTVITYEALDGSGVKASCTVTVAELSVRALSYPSSLSLGVGNKFTPTLRIEPAHVEEDILFRSSNTKVAVVDAKTGLITAKKTGSAKITAKATNGVSVVCAVTVKKAPKSITVKAGRTTLGVGETTTAIVFLSKGSAGSCTFSTSDANVVTVDESDVITALKAGKATITAKTYNGKKAKVKITVSAAPTAIRLTPAALTLGMGESSALHATLPSGSAGAYSFASSDTGIATIDAKGVVKALSKGAAVITAKTYNGKTDTCTVTVVDAPSKLTLTANRTAIGVGEKIQLTASIEPATAAGTLTFTSSNKSIAAVSATGLVTAKKNGTVTVTARMYNGTKATIKIKVKKVPTSVTVKAGRTTLGLGETTTATISLSKGSAGSWTFSTSDANVVTVDEKGIITAVAVGTATVTVKTYNGKKSTVKITVK